MQQPTRTPPRVMIRQSPTGHFLRLLALVGIILSQLAAVPLSAAPLGAVAATDVCAATTPGDGDDSPALFLPSVRNGPGNAAATSDVLGMRVAFVHGPETTAAQAYLEFLAGAGLAVSLLPASAVKDADFGKCDLIVVSAATGEWTDVAARGVLLDAQLPLVALGSGGASLLQAAGLTAGLSVGQGSATDLQPVLRGLDAYLFPHHIENATPLATVSARAATLSLYTAPSPVQWFTVPEPLPQGVEIGRLPGTQNHPVMQLNGRFLLWGYEHSPQTMTETGKDLFLNLLAFQNSELQLPLQNRRFIPSPGVDAALLNVLAITPLPRLHVYLQYDPGCTNNSAPGAGEAVHVQFLWGSTYIATVPKGFSAGSISGNPCIRWVGLIPPTDKVAPKILAGEFEEWAKSNGGIKLLVRFFDDVADADARQILQTHAQSSTIYSNHTFQAVVTEEKIAALSADDRVKWIEEGPAPSLPLNDVTRGLMHVEEVQQAQVAAAAVDYAGLDGSGIVVGVFDSGFDAAHPDFAGRILTAPADVDDHGTHVAGIVGGSGANSASEGFADYQLRGMAPGVEFVFESFSGGIALEDAADALNTYAMQLSNFSVTLSPCEGTYDQTMQAIDEWIRGALLFDGAALPAHTLVGASANEGNMGQYCADDEVGFHSLRNSAKNALVVGGLLRNGSNLIADSSSRGPTYDGRLKPDVMAIYQSRSTVPGGGYDMKNGTSMASPAAAGSAALVLQQYLMTYGAGDPPPASLRGLLIHHATDLVNEPGTAGYTPLDFWSDPDTGESLIYHQGPDFSTGYGLVNAARSVAGAAAYNVIEQQLADAAEVDEYPFEVVVGRQEVKVTLVWDDPGGDPALSPTTNKLVNDLDLVLIDPAGGVHYPYTLDPLPVSGNFTMDDVEPAYQAEDHRNNVEQVVVRVDDVADDAWIGTWTARVLATDVPSGPQPYSLVGEWRQISLPDVYPLNAGYNEDPDAILIPVQVQNPHLDPVGAAGGVKPDDWEVLIGQDGDFTEATVQTAWGPVGDQVFLVVRPPDTLQANVPYNLVVFLQHRYQQHQHTSESSQRVAADGVADAIIFDDQPRPPVDEMIVGDNSGSMGSHGKLGAAQNAARAFVDRRQAGDKIGVATFANAAGTLMGLTTVEADEMQLGAAKDAVNDMTAGGDTAMGAGLLEGKDELDANADAGHTRHMVLLSDGLENVAPCWNTDEGHENCVGAATVQPDFVSDDDCPAIQIDTVVIGPDTANWVELLADIADKSCGQPYTVRTEEDEGSAQVAAVDAEGDGYFARNLPNSLADVYLDIADGNVRQQRLVDRGGVFFISAIVEQSFELEAGLGEVVVAVNWSNEANGVKVSLFRPSGTEVFATDAGVRIKRDETHTIYYVANPEAGAWKAEIGSAAPQEYILNVSAHTPTQMLVTLGLEPEQRVPGAQLPIYVVVSDRLGVVTDADVALKLRIPGGTLVELAAHDDGNEGDHAAGDGVYTARYTLPARGGYQIKAIAEGSNNEEVAFTRFVQRHLWAKQRPRALYVHGADSAKAQAFQNLLEQHGFDVQLVTMAQIEATDFAAAAITIIGPETGAAPNWGADAQVTHIRDHAPRIAGLGKGGHAFFGKLGLMIGADPGIAKSNTSVSRWDGSDPIWNTPYDLSDGALVAVYAGAGSSGIAVNALGANVEPLGGDAPNSTPLWIVRERGRYLLWGFDLGPSAMTADGRTLFANVVWSLIE